MDKKDFESLLNNYPDCVSDGKKLKAFLKDLFPDVPKAIVNTLTIMADDGIISEMQMSTASSSLVSARLQKKLEDDYGLSQKIIAECFSLIIYDSAKQPQTTNNARSHENINVSAHTTSKSASKKENFTKNTTKSGEKPLSQSIPAKGKTTKQTNTNFAFDPKDFKIENGTLKKYKGNSSVVVIPDSVTSVGDFAFSCCSRLTSITVGNSVTSIGNCAFQNCSNLQDIYITDIAAWCNISGLIHLMRYGSSNKRLYINNELATSITIPNGATVIPGYAFKGCSSLTSITIPDSVTSIGDYAFSNCKKLTTITIPNGITIIGSWAFSGCIGLKSVTIGNSVTSIGNNAFDGCKLQDIYITDIGAWCNISGLIHLMGYGSSNKRLYINNELATSITIPNGATVIPGYAFKGCSSLTSITIPDSVMSIRDYAFSNCKKLTTITIPNGVTIIGRWAFSGCAGLTSITIPDRVTSIGVHAFSGCAGLTSITIPDRVTSIGIYAFSGCSGLKSVTIGNSVTSIGNKAFNGCKLQDIYITDIGAWCNISGLIHLMGYGSSNKRLYINNELATSITIPNGATVIPGCAFKGCSSLTSAKIPDSVTRIGKSAFSGCAGLTSITIPDSVTSIGESAFKNCIGLISIGIPSNVTRIGGKVFPGCKKTLVINCEAESKPIGWSSDWNQEDRPVVWGFKN